MSVYGAIGFFALSFGWAILIYAGWRNQRVAAESINVETTNFLPRLRAIIETILHPDHAATWQHSDGRLVFPNLGKDSSEIAGIRPDDGRVT